MLNINVEQRTMYAVELSTVNEYSKQMITMVLNTNILQIKQRTVRNEN